MKSNPRAKIEVFKRRTADLPFFFCAVLKIKSVFEEFDDFERYSTVTDFARLRGLSGSFPLSSAV